MHILRDLHASTDLKTVAIAAAMDMETEPLLNLTSFGPSVDIAGQTWRVGVFEGEAGPLQLCVITAGIGLANAASAAARAHLVFGNNLSAYMCGGTTGGLGAQTSVRDIVVGTAFTYSRADATAFGYAPGQVPGMPEQYLADPGLVNKARLTLADAGKVWFGQVTSSDAFITTANVEQMREVFPAALGADMETTAAAQVCARAGVPFISVRAVSDLCGPAANQDFHIDGEIAASISAQAVRALIAEL
ncbi:5'-methylthioadenosine/S-adenosylhomocysteine nucleosidase [Gleimia europaea]|uniref:adenosylhomocysteine nucleosidase n=1 Tax=Gleimia europaea ACS-120-V-Col10b TaxID=883069 RepID=A0A9W5RF52_9ACTO|nr:5'-methylthioadenosine/S-adenosylhomocysteine nucleosidase [Gleimia europaea]EPD31373.1 MTA/SAH nucleosidase [Gleimia europaea ACS-120-V-Col10b]